MPVSVVRRCRSADVSAARVRADARHLLAALGEAGSDVTVSLVTDPEIHHLNRAYRGKDRPTDVLAFAMREGPRSTGDEPLLGDVVISLETAARQAHRRGVSVAGEVRTLLVHGLLHLLGYDHERSAAEARRMRSMERRLLKGMQDRSAGAKKPARGKTR